MTLKRNMTVDQREDDLMDFLQMGIPPLTEESKAQWRAYIWMHLKHCEDRGRRKGRREVLAAMTRYCIRRG